MATKTETQPTPAPFKKYRVQIQRIRRDFAIVEVAASSIDRARRHALRVARTQADSRFCDGRKSTMQVKQCYEVAKD